MKHAGAVYCRKETSPDGALGICYNYSEGEKTPTIIEPCVTLVATGEVLLDLWGTRMNGQIGEFTAMGFRLAVSDNFHQTTIVSRVELPLRTFTVAGDLAGPRPLVALNETLFFIIEREHLKRASSRSLPESRPAILSRLARWFSGTNAGSR